MKKEKKKEINIALILVEDEELALIKMHQICLCNGMKDLRKNDVTAKKDVKTFKRAFF